VQLGIHLPEFQVVRIGGSRLFGHGVLRSTIFSSHHVQQGLAGVQH